MQLPFFVVHGAVVWKVLLGVLIALSLGLVALRRRTNERRRAAADVRTRLGQTTPLQAGAVLVRGRIATGTASTSQRGKAEPTSTRSEQLTLDHEGEQVAIMGDVTVELGASSSTRWLRRTLTRTVSPGDEVVVAGIAERCPDDDAHYRDAGIGWRLTGGCRIAAVTPSSTPVPSGPVLGSVAAIAFGIAWFGVLHMIGSRANARADISYDERRSSLGNFDAVSIAAAMPGSRHDALNELAHQLRYNFDHTEDAYQARLQLEELLGSCRAYALFHDVRLEDALTAARACGDHELASQALAFLGEFEAAWAEPGRDARPFVTGLLAIATGRWAEAAVAAEARAEEYGARKRGTYYTDADAQTYALRARCTAALFATWAGQTGAFEKIAGYERSDRCRVLAALALPSAEQPAALAQLTFSDEHDYVAKELRDHVLHSLDATYPTEDYYYRSIADMIGFGLDRTAWFAPGELAIASPELSPRAHASLLSENASLLAFRGDIAGARKRLDEANAITAGDHYRLSNELALGLVDPGATLTDDTGYIHPGITEMVEFRKGRIPKPDHILSMITHRSGCETRVLPAIVAGQGGDGGPLAALMRECDVSWNVAQRMLLAVMPRVKTHREELAAQVRLFTDDISTYSLDNIPFMFLGDVAWYRFLAAAIGDAEAAARWQAIFDRHAKVLADRTKLIALLLWSD